MPGAARRELARFFQFLHRKVYFGRRTNQAVIDRFHRLYYESEVMWKTKWFGHVVVKCPLDLWVYQEIIHEQRPDVILETGTYRGGSALYLANILDLVGHGRVITVDVEARADRPKHPRIEYVAGSSTDPAIVDKVNRIIGGSKRVLIILDSDHRRAHVLGELKAYSDLVPPGGYVIVEDSNVNGHPAWPGWGEGPWEAIDDFLAQDDRFVSDREREKFFMSMNPRGFLKRIR